MHFYRALYVSPSIEDVERAKHKLRCGAGDPTLYILALSPDSAKEGGNQIEFFHSAVLQQPYYRKYPPLIIGLARGRSECIGLVERILAETYRHTGDWNIRPYLCPNGLADFVN